ncbi:hypothetical protein MN116_007800 [Schistosoma mekongi]|uniref:Tubulin--tyrosine ligase-like protein 12 SET-like domain-containing protein n=1 Tax=Schistosoma mekongi TaxID=38744 RepID=A0AAE2D375_SCHME|nr:hypothetical protein MN116_007800 [Schistosoma mekongi]
MNGAIQPDFKEFLKLHNDQLRASGIPGRFWHRLHEKLIYEIYDANTCVMMQQIEYTKDDEDDNEELVVDFDWNIVVCTDQLLTSDSNNIFIVDHAWTFDIQSMKQCILQLPNLLERMASLMNIVTLNQTNENIALDICKNVWKYCRYYKLSTKENMLLLSQVPELQQLIWYIVDEVGSRIQHSDKPTARMVPFYYVPRKMCYSVFWPIKDLQKDDSITIDFIEHVKDTKLRPYYLLPWRPQDFSAEPIEHTYILTNEYFTSHRVQETLPVYRVNEPVKRESFTVYTDLNQVKQYLTSAQFTFVDSPDTADIIWMHRHFKDFERLSVDNPNTYINQFPGEYILTVKDFLASLAASIAKDSYDKQSNAVTFNDDNIDAKLSTSWHPVTFNLVYELPQFCAYFQSNYNKCITNNNESVKNVKHNLWILKPWNLGRGVGIVITDNLDRIIRTCDTNPLIASRYITDAVLFYRDDLQANVKFDIRYVVLLRSVKPLILYAYKVFWLRFANKPFILDDFDEYDRHFTVMNYRSADNLKQIHCDEFVELFDKQYPEHKWSKVESRIHQLLVDIFQAATKYPSPRGLTHSIQSRALYAVDILLEWRPEAVSLSASPKKDMYPVVCEVNFSPDCERACRYHPNFFNDVYSCLFLDHFPDSCNVHKLT